MASEAPLVAVAVAGNGGTLRFGCGSATGLSAAEACWRVFFWTTTGAFLSVGTGAGLASSDFRKSP
ncbi:MAG TPA: hypothetical protein DCR20_04220, partial [Planctomycetaceae bacterium]|nr:hypothetical protein [Planctomycetaceae bacterium]